jgi:hypothetical protein
MMGMISETLWATLASDPSLEMITEGGPAMNSLDDNDVIIYHGTGNFLDLRIGKRGHARKGFPGDVDSGVVEVESGRETENVDAASNIEDRIGTSAVTTIAALDESASNESGDRASRDTDNIRPHAWSLLPVDTSHESSSGFFQDFPTEENYTISWRLAPEV